MGTQYVVKATLENGSQERWITTPRLAGRRTFGPRSAAAVFLSWNGAERAIREIREVENCSAVTFEVQAIERRQDSARKS